MVCAMLRRRVCSLHNASDFCVRRRPSNWPGHQDPLRCASELFRPVCLPQATTSSASAFSALYSRNEDDSHGLTKKFSDAVMQLEDRSRSRAVRSAGAVRKWRGMALTSHAL